jgi:hypothetical protein
MKSKRSALAARNAILLVQKRLREIVMWDQCSPFIHHSGYICMGLRMFISSIKDARLFSQFIAKKFTGGRYER